MEVQVQVGVRCVCGTVVMGWWALGVARCGLSLTPPVMCEHVRGWHQATPMFSTSTEPCSSMATPLEAKGTPANKGASDE